MMAFIRLKHILFIIFGLSSLPIYASVQYMEKFNQYRYWNTHLPPQTDPNLLQFLHQPGPLAHQLNEKWLLFLGEKQNWPALAQYYQPSNSTTLQCYAATAYWQTNQRDKAIRIATPLWLDGHNKPQACQAIFQSLVHDPQWRNQYWSKRISKALDEKELLLARQLLHHGSQIDQMAADNFWRIHTQPEYFVKLPSSPWRGEQTLYALKRMIELNRKNVMTYYHRAIGNSLLNHDQTQRLHAHMALYHFMRNDAQGHDWLTKVSSPYISTSLLEWQMRYNLLHQKWSTVETTIHRMAKPYTPEQTYWLAQAEKHLNQSELSKQHLRELAKQRNYYGFLASNELNIPPSFQENPRCTQTILPYEYHDLQQEIKQLYSTKTIGRAAGLLHDFMLELPSSEKCSLVHWVSDDLNWPTEAIVLSNEPGLINQLSVRFPTKYSDFIKHRAQQFHLDPAFVYAIIRQESAFHPQVVSPVGARGLMQMMPRTAKLITQNYHIPYRLDEELFTPYKNIEIGTQYLAHLSKLFGQHPLLIAAAYNAGPQAVYKWINLFPAPNVVTWIDTLPWKETRNYLKNIIAFQIIYQHRLGYHPSMKNLIKPFPVHSFRHDQKRF
jgi:soluble lytic murein transglycosylase